MNSNSRTAPSPSFTRRRSLWSTAALCLVTLTLVSCGGGGGGGGGDEGDNPTTQASGEWDTMNWDEDNWQ